MKTKEEILKEFRERFRYKFDICNKDEKIEVNGNWLFIEDFISQALAQTREETLKEIIREYQDNELDGKGYDFYFSIRAKIDELNKLKKQYMTYNQGQLFANSLVYCMLKVRYDELKWWEFPRKIAVKKQMNWYYPLMVGEINNFHKLKK